MQSSEPPVDVPAITNIQYQNNQTVLFQAVDNSQVADSITV